MISNVTYESLTSEDRDLMLNGCGPQVGDFENTADFFTAACNLHDFRYRVGGPRDMADGDSSWRFKADKEFKRNMYRMISDSISFWLRWLYYFKAWGYYRLVRNYGSSAFKFRPEAAIVTLDMMRAEAIIDGREDSPLFTAHISKNGVV